MPFYTGPLTRFIRIEGAHLVPLGTLTPAEFLQRFCCLFISSFTRYMADIGMFGKVRKPSEHLVLSQVAGKGIARTGSQPIKCGCECRICLRIREGVI